MHSAKEKKCDKFGNRSSREKKMREAELDDHRFHHDELLNFGLSKRLTFCIAALIRKCKRDSN